MVTPDQRKNTLSSKEEFWTWLGAFHTGWSAIEVTTDYALAKFLNLTAEECHLVSSGIMFGKKARLLADLIHRSDHPNKMKIQESFGKLRGNNKREIIAHGYIQSTEKTISFLERNSSNEFRARRHDFTTPLSP